MSEELSKSTGESNIISTRDLGDGRKEVTFSLDATSVQKYMENISDIPNAQVTDERPSIAKGSIMSRYLSQSPYSEFTSRDTPYTTALRTPSDPHKKIELATELYFKEPIIGTSIDLMVDFSQSGFTNECDDSDIKKLYDKWCEEININQLLENIFLDYYRSGNVTIYRSDKKAKVTKKRKAKSGLIDISEYSFPSGYTVLNPMNVFIYGPMMFNNETIVLQFNSQFVSWLQDGSVSSQVYNTLPTEIVQAMKDGKGTLTLNPQYVTRLTRKKQPYERYASPFLERVFEPVIYKQKLRQMDMSTIEGIVNQLVTVTVGDKDFPATDDDLTAIAELFQTPNKAYTIFWNHTLNVKFHKPEGLDTLTQDKYKQVNEDIVAGLGVPRVLVDGQGANFSTAWVSILSLIERLENARHKVKHWLESEYRRIAEENGFKTCPTVRFNNMNLREDTYIQNVLIAMYDRGLIDAEDLLTETGRDYEAIIEMKKRNEKNDELFLPPEQPFQGGQTGPNGGGRESGKTGNTYKKRTTTPEQNSGNPPKTSKTSKASASYNNLQEEYESELSGYYDSIQAEVRRTIDEHKDEDEKVLHAIILSTILAMFMSVSKLGDRTIDSIFNNTVTDYYDNIANSKLQLARKELRQWNESYVVKLADDIREEIKAGLSSDNIDVVISQAFDSNRYRVKLISEAGVVESIRQARIQGNTLAGSKNATWITTMDDRACKTCSGLHGQQFAISDVPPRPHSSCRCDLEFS